MAGPSPSQVEQGKVFCKDQRAVGLCRGCFLTGTVLLRIPVGARQGDRTAVYEWLGTGGDAVIVACFICGGIDLATWAKYETKDPGLDSCAFSPGWGTSKV